MPPLLFALLAAPAGAAGLADGLTFYADLDRSANAYFARGEPAEAYRGGGTRLAPGLIGRAVQVGPAEGGTYRALQFDTARHLATTGALAFWIKAAFPWSRPGVSRPDETYRVLLNVPGFDGNFGFLLYHYEPPGAEPSRLYFCTYGLRPDRQDYAPSYTFPPDSVPWKPGEWHHLAYVWTPTLKRLFLDGELVAEALAPWLDERFHFDTPMTLGLRPDVSSTNYVPTAAAFDEWAIWDRTLSPDEVRQVYADGRAGRALREVLSLAETQSPRKQTPAASFRSGNLVPNGSFEVGLRGGWMVEGLEELAPTLELGGGARPPHGVACARIPLRSPAPSAVILRHQLFQAPADRPLTFSAYARSNAPGARLELRVWGSYLDDSTRPVGKSFELTSAWARHVFTFTPFPAPWDAHFPEAIVSATGPGTAWVDAVQIEPGSEATPFRPYEPLEAGLTTDQPANLFLAGEPLKLRLALHTGQPAEVGDLRLRFLDYRGNEVLLQNLPAGRLAAGRGEVAVGPPLRRTGAFRVEVRRGERVLEETLLSILPRPRTDVDLTTTNAGAHWVLNREHSRLMRRLGIRWARIHDCSTITWWETVEPERGRFVFNDEPLKALAAEGCEALGVLSWSVPRWARDEKEDRQFPFRLDDWARYVEATVSHFRPSIRYWEVWNEAGGGPSPDRYRDLLRVSYDAIRRADPSAVVVAPCTFPMPHCEAWNRRVMLDDGGLALTDLFSFHYGGWDPANLGQMRALAVSDGKRRPVWNTETNEGWACETAYTRFLPHLTTPYIRWMGKPRPAAEVTELAPRLFVGNRAAGVDRLFYYWLYYERGNLAGPRLTSWCGFEFDGTLRPRTVSFATAIALLDGARFERALDFGAEVRAYLFTRGERATVALWRETGPPAPLQLTGVPKGARVRDLMGNPVEAPVSDGSLHLTVGPAMMYLELPRGAGDLACRAAR